MAATLSTFLAKFFVAISFALPLIWSPLDQAVVVGVMWGLTIVGVMSYVLARVQGASAWKAIGEHVAIALAVVVLSHYVGIWVRYAFA